MAISGVLRETLERISLEDLRRDERTMVTWLDLQVMPGANSAGEQRS